MAYKKKGTNSIRGIIFLSSVSRFDSEFLCFLPLHIILVDLLSYSIEESSSWKRDIKTHYYRVPCEKDPTRSD